MTKIRKIAVLTSGGDAPGMNAAIRAVARAALYNDLEVFGVMHGYAGLINGDFKVLESHDLSAIIGKGGTILKTARSSEFMTAEGRQKAYVQLKKRNIDALVVIGGDGTLQGARKLTEEQEIPVVGIPGTIDNDLYGTDCTIGYDTALNTVVQAVDKIRDTASAHNRIFFIEVMGRDAGFIALRGGIASGAEAILIPEVDTDANDLKAYFDKSFKRKKSSYVVLVAEGNEAGGAFEIAKKFEKDFTDFDVRVTILGHIQRGGSPSAFDRVIASQMGIAAVDALLDDQKSIMVGIVNNKIAHVPFNKAIKYHKDINRDYLEIVDILSM